MADNVLKGVVDTVSEEDNDIGGMLVTRLREVTEFGRDNGSVLAASPTTLTSPVDVFVAGDVGRGFDVIEPFSGVASGNEGSYIVATYVDSKNITATKIDGTAASFTDQDPVRWRWTTLRVETTWQFPDNDRLLQLWIGDEADPCPYAELDSAVGAQEIRGLGGHRLILDGAIDSGAATTLSSVDDRFTASDAGKAAWVLPKDPVTGNEGPQLITAFIDSKNVTVNPGFTADETSVRVVIKNYEGGGYMTDRSRRAAPLSRSFHRVLSEVIDASGGYSAIGRLRRAMLVDFAEEEELDRVGRNLAVIRPRGLDDEHFRCLIKNLAYLPRATIYGIELVLECLFPGGDWEIYEDLINFPNNVFIILPEMAGDSPDFEGKAFLSPSGNTTVPGVIDPPGKGGREAQTSTSATTVDVTHSIISVCDVLLEDEEFNLDMDVLPSVDTPAWTFNAETGGVEGNTFSVVNISGTHNVLGHTPDGAPSAAGGNYTRVANKMDIPEGATVRISGWFRRTVQTLINGRPWVLAIRHDGLNKEIYLRWSDTDIALTDAAGAIPAGAPAAATVSLALSEWHRFELVVYVTEKGDFAKGKLDGHDLFGAVNLALYSATAANEFLFGYEDLGAGNQNWTAQWDEVGTFIEQRRNYYNRFSSGTFTGGGSPNFNDGSNPFVAGDVGKFLRSSGYERTADTFVNRNSGVWKVATFVGAGAVGLVGITRGPDAADDLETQGVTVSGGNADVTAADRPGSGEGAIITIPEGDAGIFRIEDGPTMLDNATGGYDPVSGGSGDGKTVVLSNSGLGNDGDFPVLEVLDPWRVRVDASALGGAEFVAEIGLSWAFKETLFTASVGASDYEVVDKGSHAAPTITLGDTLPSGTEDVEVWYTSVLSAQILRSEFVQNEGSLGAEPGIYYPFYIFDVDRATRQILDEITAAGVIPEYARVF
jgi:hypothetical protein